MLKNLNKLILHRINRRIISETTTEGITSPKDLCIGKRKELAKTKRSMTPPKGIRARRRSPRLPRLEVNNLLQTTMSFSHGLLVQEEKTGEVEDVEETTVIRDHALRTSTEKTNRINKISNREFKLPKPDLAQKLGVRMLFLQSRLRSKNNRTTTQISEEADEAGAEEDQEPRTGIVEDPRLPQPIMGRVEEEDKVKTIRSRITEVDAEEEEAITGDVVPEEEQQAHNWTLTRHLSSLTSLLGLRRTLVAAPVLPN